MTEKKTIIVVVDDDPAVRKALKFALELDGFEVHACESGRELLDHAALPSCHCIVLDYKMPGMDGLEVLDRLTAARIAAPVIFVTGPVTKDLRERALRKGARLVMEKPLLDRSLTQKIHEITD
ncbi:MAG TPA: response regulator [Rhizomicrobium sp.]|nr:response regulator [Rhizomicrobium sp.]